MLMVAALQCNSWRNPARADYNAFVMAHLPTLNMHNDVLKLYFGRAKGFAGGQSAYDRFTTQLANHDSALAQRMSADYCMMAAAAARTAARSHPADLDELSEEIGGIPAGVGTVCGLPEAPALFREATVEPPIADKPLAVEAPAIEAAEPEPPAPVEVAAATAQVAAAPSGGGNATADALAAAAVALKAAAEALKAAAAAPLPEQAPVTRIAVPSPVGK